MESFIFASFSLMTTTNPNPSMTDGIESLPNTDSEQDLLNAAFIESIEQRASELEVTCDYYLSEFLLWTLPFVIHSLTTWNTGTWVLTHTPKRSSASKSLSVYRSKQRWKYDRPLWNAYPWWIGNRHWHFQGGNGKKWHSTWNMGTDPQGRCQFINWTFLLTYVTNPVIGVFYLVCYRGKRNQANLWPLSQTLLQLQRQLPQRSVEPVRLHKLQRQQNQQSKKHLLPKLPSQLSKVAKQSQRKPLWNALRLPVSSHLKGTLQTSKPVGQFTILKSRNWFQTSWKGLIW